MKWSHSTHDRAICFGSFLSAMTLFGLAHHFHSRPLAWIGLGALTVSVAFNDFWSKRI